jgi:hypothetical protein
MHVAGAIYASDQSARCNKHINHVIDWLDDVITADAIALQDSHGYVVARLGAVPIWHNQAKH